MTIVQKFDFQLLKTKRKVFVKNQGLFFHMYNNIIVLLLLLQSTNFEENLSS